MTDRPSREQVLAAPPGPQLDAWAAEALGYVPCDLWTRQRITEFGPMFTSGDCGHELCYPREFPVRFSELAGAAFGPLLDEMTRKGWQWESGSDEWVKNWALFSNDGTKDSGASCRAEEPNFTNGATPAHALTRAAVLAMIEE